VVESKPHMNRARAGGLRRIELYGNPGTLEGRSRGGKKTTTSFQLNPDLAKSVGFIVRKDIAYPGRSAQLAEFMGILLGDGGLPGNHQVTITFNRNTDNEYAEYICTILKSLFSVGYGIRKRKDSKGADIVVSSSNLVDFLVKQGFITGNKVKNQIGLPSWILEKREYRLACLRGLIDTDGSLYLHRYKSDGKVYQYVKLCFTNRSVPLLDFVFKTLKELNYKVYLHGNNVLIYSTFEVKRYLAEIGTHNSKHANRFKRYFVN